MFWEPFIKPLLGFYPFGFILFVAAFFGYFMAVSSFAVKFKGYADHLINGVNNPKYATSSDDDDNTLVVVLAFVSLLLLFLCSLHGYPYVDGDPETNQLFQKSNILLNLVGILIFAISGFASFFTPLYYIPIFIYFVAGLPLFLYGVFAHIHFYFFSKHPADPFLKGKEMSATELQRALLERPRKTSQMQAMNYERKSDEIRRRLQSRINQAKAQKKEKVMQQEVERLRAESAREEARLNKKFGVDTREERKTLEALNKSDVDLVNDYIGMRDAQK